MGDEENKPAILASDAERDQTVDVLRTAVVEGRLTLEEFSERVGLAQAARTDQDLALLRRDLPASAPATGLETPPLGAVDDTRQERHLAFCSHLDRRGPWALPPRSSYRSVFGTIDLDLTQARLAGDEIELEIHNVFGTVTLIVPEGIEVTVSGGGLFASQRIDPPAVSGLPSAPKLRIRTSGPGGTLYVRNHRPEPGALARLLDGLRAAGPNQRHID